MKECRSEDKSVFFEELIDFSQGRIETLQRFLLGLNRANGKERRETTNQDHKLLEEINKKELNFEKRI